MNGSTTNQIEIKRSALNYLAPNCSREEWIRLGMAAKAAGLSFDDFHDWSKNADNYKNRKDCEAVWKSFDDSGAITEATLFGAAISAGWKNRTNLSPSRTYLKKQPTAHAASSKTRNEKAYDIWERCLPAPNDHDYIIRKKGKPDGLRIYSETDPPLIISNQNVAGYLVVPCFTDDEIQTLQFIPPSNGQRKLNLPNAQFNDGFFTVGDIKDVIYICEGIGQAWAVNHVTNMAAIACFGAGRMMSVAKILRSKHPVSDLVIIADRGKEKEASEIAKEVNGKWVELPREKETNYDANDYLLEHGTNALLAVIAHPKFNLPLDVIFADELLGSFTPPDELVEGVLTTGGGSILYGDSNTGKTFFVIDLACAIARGINWMNKRTEQGLVVYLATESPSSVNKRLRAYQKHHGVIIKNFVIVQNPINLFSGESDTNAIIQLVLSLEKQLGQKVVLIVGDTLARLSAGANENAGQDMGVVVRHIDCIRNECNAHFMVIHHKGKNASSGARGWSGVRAAVDTEIELTDSPTGKCAEITKQRDMDTKGLRIGFRLEPVTIGVTKWNSPITSCVVFSADAPKKTIKKRLNAIDDAILEYLSSFSTSIKKSALVSHIKGRGHPSSVIYREIKKLNEIGLLTDIMGLISLVQNSTK